jgi:hypothetical protein
MKKVIAVALGFILIHQSLFAGAWPQKKENGYYKLNFRFINAENFYDAEGEKISLAGTFIDYTLGFYGEYGLTDNLTIQTVSLLSGILILNLTPDLYRTAKTQ